MSRSLSFPRDLFCCFDMSRRSLINCPVVLRCRFVGFAGLSSVGALADSLSGPRACGLDGVFGSVVAGVIGLISVFAVDKEGEGVSANLRS